MSRQTNDKDGFVSSWIRKREVPQRTSGDNCSLWLCADSCTLDIAIELMLSPLDVKKR